MTSLAENQKFLECTNIFVRDMFILEEENEIFNGYPYSMWPIDNKRLSLVIGKSVLLNCIVVEKYIRQLSSKIILLGECFHLEVYR